MKLARSLLSLSLSVFFSLQGKGGVNVYFSFREEGIEEGREGVLEIKEGGRAALYILLWLYFSFLFILEMYGQMGTYWRQCFTEEGGGGEGGSYPAM